MPKGKRLGKGALLAFGLTAALGLALCLQLSEAWRATVLREAYLPQLEAMAAQSPSDGPLLALLGGRLMEAHEHAAAAVMLRRAVAAGDTEAVDWLSLAAALAASGDRTLALTDLRLAAESLPHDGAIQAALARCRELPSDAPPEAYAVMICPQGPTPLIRARTQGSFWNGAFEWWGLHHRESSGFTTRQRWVAQRPNDAQALRLWGLALMQNRRLPDALPILRQAVVHGSASPAAHLAVAQALDQSGQHAQAGLQYITCLKLRPDWLPALLGLGQNALEDRLQHAIPAYLRATQVAPGSVTAWIGLGRAYLQGPATGKALAAFQTASRLAPDRTDFFNDYAEALRKASRWEEAEALLRRRLRAVPDDAQCHFLLGKVLRDSASSPPAIAEAEAQTREALRLYPGQPLAEKQLAELLLRRGDARQAVPLLQSALAADPYDTGTLNVLTRALRQVGDMKAAQALTIRSNRVFSDQQQLKILENKEHHDLMNMTVHQALARLYRRTGQTVRQQQEEEMINLLRTNPQKVARDQQNLRASLKQVLPDAGQ